MREREGMSIMKWKKPVALALGILLMAAALTGCMRSGSNPEPSPEATGSDAKPEIPSKLSKEDGVPQLDVYNVAAKGRAGHGHRELRAGRAGGRDAAPTGDGGAQGAGQSGEDLRTEVRQREGVQVQGRGHLDRRPPRAQAYDESKINDRIIKAVDETRGQVLSNDGAFLRLFHAHAGGQTELATKALDFEGQEPPYTQSVKSNDSDRAPDAVKNWTASFTAEEVGDAAAKGGRGHRHGANHRDRRKGANPAARSPSSSTDRMSAARRFASRSTRPSSSPRWSARSPSPTARCPSPAAATGTAWA